jgi:hypothetical protein
MVAHGTASACSDAPELDDVGRLLIRRGWEVAYLARKEATQ